VAACVQAKVPDLLEAVRQHVLKEALQKLDGMECFGLAVLGPECDRVVLELDEPAVGDSDSVSVATEVTE
jgi:hypothetical protein